MHPLVTEKSESGFNTTIKLYHGSNAKFDEFDKDMAGSNTGYQDADNGFYLTSNPMLAENYAIGAVGRNGGLKAVMEFHVSISNPKIYARSTDFYRDLDNHKANGSSLIEKLKEDGVDAIIVRADMEEVVIFEAKNIRACKLFKEVEKKDDKEIVKKDRAFFIRTKREEDFSFR